MLEVLGLLEEEDYFKMVKSKFWRDVKRDLKENREGLLGGTGLGIVVAAVLQKQGVSALMAASETGLLDVVAPNMPPMDIATIKFYLAAMAVGAVFGYFVDKYTKWI